MDDKSTSEPHVQEFFFDDGGLRGLASALVWSGLVYFCTTLEDSVLCQQGVIDLARSLLAIPTYCKRPDADPARAMIGRIIRQNVEAKKMAVSSFEWAQILGNLAKEGEKLTLPQALEMYNSSPEVAAHGGGSSKDCYLFYFDPHPILQFFHWQTLTEIFLFAYVPLRLPESPWKDKSGTGSLILDTKKQYAIKHWLERTAPLAREEVMISLRDSPFAFGPWGESLSVMSFLFMESSVDLVAVSDTGLLPAAHEATVALNWSLPMTHESQQYLFHRIRLAFDKSTAIIDNAVDKKRG